MSFNAKWFLVLGSANAAITVALGAASVHALKAQLSLADPAGWFAVALQYHQYHSLGLILVGMAAIRFPSSKAFTWAGWLMLSGIVLFSGDLYVISLTGIQVTHLAIPFGGVAFILGWCFFALGAIRLPRQSNIAVATGRTSHR